MTWDTPQGLRSAKEQRNHVYWNNAHIKQNFSLFFGSGDSVNLCESIYTMLEEFVSIQNHFYTKFYRCSQRLRDHVTAFVYWHTEAQG